MKNVLRAILPLLLAAGCVQTTTRETGEKKTASACPLTALRIRMRDCNTPEKRQRICGMLDKYGCIDEVCLATAPGPQSLAVHRKTLDDLLKMAEELRKRNITVSLQLSGAADCFGGPVFEAQDAYKWMQDDLMVGIDGATQPGICCPTSPTFAAWCTDVLAMYCAKLKPQTACIGDDLRFHGLGRIDQGCCCVRCLERFAALTGRKWTREQVREMLVSPELQPMRLLWIELHTQIVADICRFAAERVFAVSPDTHLGIQNPHAGIFSTCWNFAPVFAVMKTPAGRPARIRIGGGTRHDFTPSSITEKSFLSTCDIDDAKEGKAVDLIGHEEENLPGAVMNKSAHARALEAAMHLAVGGSSVTFNSENLWQDPDSSATELLATVRTWHPLFARLRMLSQKYKFDGITALVQGRIQIKADPSGAPWYVLRAEESGKLRSASLPLRLSKHASRRGGSPGFLTAETARGISKETFARFLRSGVVMTGNAYLELQKLGLTEEFGVTAAPAPWTDTARFETGELPNNVGNGWFPQTSTIIFYFLLQQCHHSHNTLGNK